MSSKDELILQLQRQVEEWKTKYQALAKLYSQLRTEHLDLLNKSKAMQLRANSAQEAVDRMERMERDVKAKNLELADMIRERDRSRFDIDRLKSVSSIISTCIDSSAFRKLLTDIPSLFRPAEPERRTRPAQARPQVRQRTRRRRLAQQVR
jgi:chromosome segregation ATPase